jgi:hypothetical protein
MSLQFRKEWKEKGGKYYINGRMRNLTTGPTNSRCNSPPLKKKVTVRTTCVLDVCNISFYLFRQTVWKFCTPIFCGGSHFLSHSSRHWQGISRSTESAEVFYFVVTDKKTKKTKIKSDFAQLGEKQKKKSRSQWQVTRIRPSPYRFYSKAHHLFLSRQRLDDNPRQRNYYPDFLFLFFLPFSSCVELKVDFFFLIFRQRGRRN